MRATRKSDIQVLVVCAVLCFAWHTDAWAQDGGNKAFDNAVRTFQYQDYGRAQKLFQELLYPDVILEEVDQSETPANISGLPRVSATRSGSAGIHIALDQLVKPRA